MYDEVPIGNILTPGVLNTILPINTLKYCIYSVLSKSGILGEITEPMYGEVARINIFF